MQLMQSMFMCNDRNVKSILGKQLWLYKEKKLLFFLYEDDSSVNDAKLTNILIILHVSSQNTYISN